MPPPRSAAPTPQASLTPPPSDDPFGLFTPHTYVDACHHGPSVCQHPTTQVDGGRPPDSMLRPLRLPQVAPGADCPTTPGTQSITPAFGGIALGTGPVRPVGSFDKHGNVVVTANTWGGWIGSKTLWSVAPTYDGPVLIRGARIDGTGPVAFGESPQTTQLLFAPGATINEASGYREAPGGTWVRTSGCYAWQVDGLDFSTVIVFKFQAPPGRRRR